MEDEYHIIVINENNEMFLILSNYGEPQDIKHIHLIKSNLAPSKLKELDIDELQNMLDERTQGIYKISQS